MSPEGRLTTPRSISLDGVSKVYNEGQPGEVRAIDKVDLNVNQGEFVSLLGPSGCGKSTLLKMIAGLYTASTGAIRVGGQPVTRPVTELGFVFQSDVLLPWRNVLQNVLLQIEVRSLPVVEYRERALELLDLAGLTGFEGASIDALSGGMKQRVAVCRALVHDPPVLLMDEPFGALDAMTRDQLGLDLQRFSGNGTTVLFVTHSIEEAVFLSDRVVVMSNRPSVLAAEFRIGLPRPRQLRHRESAEFMRYTNSIRDVFLSLGIIRG